MSKNGNGYTTKKQEREHKVATRGHAKQADVIHRSQQKRAKKAMLAGDVSEGMPG